MTPKNRKKAKGAVKTRAEYLLYRAVAAPLRLAPAPLIRGLGSSLGTFFPAILRRRQAMVLRNLAYIFPEKSEAERQTIARDCWKFFTGVVFRFLHNSKHTSEQSARLATFDSPEMLAALMARDQGLIIITGHFGDWEGAIHALNSQDVPITVVVRMLDNDLLNRDLYRARVRSHVVLADRRNAARAMLRTLEKKGIVVILADQAPQPREGIVAPFLGRPAWTTPSPARLSLRTGAPIFCVFAKPAADGLTVNVEGDTVLDPATIPESKRTVEGLTTMMNDVISARIRKEPALWLWMHDRWKGTDR